jgi:hypothetical protein
MGKMRRSHLVRFSLALAVAGLAFGDPAARAESEESMARDLVPAQKPLFELGGTRGREVEAWVDKSDLTYRVGQRLKVFVRPKETSYITVLNVGSSGRVSVIFPNYYQRDMRVRAGRTIKIPADGAGWHIDVAGPAGVELIKVIASKNPLDLRELARLAAATQQEPIVSLGRSSEEVARDLIPQIGKPAGGKDWPGGFKNILVRVLPRGAALPTETLGSQHFGGAFGLTLRPERAVYRIGDTVRVAVAVERDCRLSLISLGTSGQALRLFPNHFQSDNVVRAGQTVLIPSLRSPVQFKARGPAGVEGLVAICRGVGNTAELPPIVPGGFAPVGDVGSVTRDLVAAAGPGGEVERVSGSFLITN